MAEETRAWIALGANLGERREAFRAALDSLKNEGCRLEALSSLYHSAAVGPPPQEDYLNAVVRLRTSLEPRALLALCKGLEAAAGRRSGLRWGPRPLDLDILLLAGRDGRLRSHRDGTLCVPHAGLRERTFVLHPLAELNPELELEGKTIRQWLQGLQDREPLVTQLRGKMPWYPLPSVQSLSKE